MEKKKHSYIKFLMWMALGGVIGGILGFASALAVDGIAAGFEAVYLWISEQLVWLMGILLAASVIISVVCFRKGEALIKQCQTDEDDDSQDMYDKRYGFWGTIGMTGTSIIMYLAFPLLAFNLNIQSKSDANTLILLVALFLAIGMVCGFYQVAAIKQIRRKDPLKQGDAADWSFKKDWISGCDEAEKRQMYEAGFQAFTKTKSILLLASVIAMTCELFFGNGLSAVILLTLCNIISVIIYTYHCTKPQMPI